MARFPAIGALLLLLVLLAATGEMTGTTKTAEARTCSSPSHRFKGLCFSHHNCANVCHNEGFHGGDCHGARRRCMCTKSC